MTNSRWFRRATVFFAGMVFLEATIAWQLFGSIAEGQPDFTIFYTAATMVKEGAGHALYDTERQRAVELQFAPQLADRTKALPYNHPAFEALLFLPLAYLPYVSAYVAWGVVNVVLILLLVALLCRHVPLMQRSGYIFWLLAALSFFPVFVALLQGQDSILLLLVCVLSYIALRRHAFFAAGVLLGLGLFRFHLVVPLVLIFLLHREWRIIGGFASASAGLAGISAGIVGLRQAILYPYWLWHLEKGIGSNPLLLAAMPNTRGLLYVLLRSEGGVSARVLLGITGLLLLVWAATKCKFRTTPDNLDLSFSLMLVITVVTSYHALPHDMSLLFLAAVLVTNYLAEDMAQGVRGASIDSSRAGVNETASFRPQRFLGWKPAATLLAPLIVLAFGPGQMLLWFRGRHFSLLAPVLLVWAWGIAQAIETRSAARSSVASTSLA
jgi:hypothetical protein